MRLRPALRFALTALVLAGVWLAGTTVVGGAVRSEEARRERQLVDDAGRGAAALSAWFADARAGASGLASALTPWSGSSEQVTAAKPALDSLVLPLQSADDGAVVVDLGRRVVAASASKADLVGQVRDWDHVRAALAGDVAVSGILEDPLEGGLTLGAAAPLRDEAGNVSGAVATSTRLDTGSFARVLAAVPGLVVAPGGMVLALGDPPRAGGPHAALVAAPVDRPGLAGPYAGDGGEPTVAGYGPAGGGWAVVVPVPKADLRLDGPKRATGAGLAALLGVALAVLTVLDLRRRALAREVDRAKRAFLSIAGHELRTPLTTIKGFTRTLLARWDAVPDDVRRDLVETIGRQSRNLEHLVERLLVGAQLEAGFRERPAPEPVDLGVLMEQTVEHHRALSPVHEIVVERDADLVVRGDPRSLDQVLSNLVENAVKYSPEGGVILIRARRVRDGVEVVVEDEGIGLPADLDAIFEKFTQGEAVDTRTHDEGGVGLGLYIVKTHVEGMRGSVRAERRSPTGARFVVNLPSR